MRTKLAVTLVVLAAVAGGVWFLSTPQPLPASVLPAEAGNPVNGEKLFWAGGCVSCHASADDLASFNPMFAPVAAADVRLGGGKALVTPAGTFFPPNISPDKEHGIGSWTMLDFINAMKRGIAPGGRHLYPAFPYTSYQRMSVKDLVDLKVFMDALPAVTTPSQPNALAFPFSMRWTLGLWKRLFLDGNEFKPDPAKGADINRGAYLVQGPGHCNECHTRRVLFGAIGLAALDRFAGVGMFGGLDRAHALAGAPNPSGTGKPIPNITTGPGGIEGGAAEIADRLLLGQLDGDMAEVQKNLQMLDHVSPGDVAAIAAYLTDVTPQASLK